jgi:uncharacterized protein
MGSAMSDLCRLPKDNQPCYICAMNSQEAIETLQRSEPALRARGVRRAALFGSVARGENRPGSDIDIMVEIDPEAHITVFDYVGLKEYIAGLFDSPVDVVSRDSLKPYLRPTAIADAIYAFEGRRAFAPRYSVPYRSCHRIRCRVRSQYIQERSSHAVCGHTLSGNHFRSISPLAGRFEGATSSHRVEADGWCRECLSPRL